MLRKWVLLIVAASFLFIVNGPNHASNQHHSIQLHDTIGGYQTDRNKKSSANLNGSAELFV
ncbi:hypothetical protein C1I60_20650 [Paenibacillus terrae]|uniref:Uncharacterized protein n=1 Tax=Paenibacillus terrae TaxID=159743 RepID=A0A4U2PT46_9BACL|nr:hypothetical protein C1I60_20650 [Paenibacillus terrae]